MKKKFTILLAALLLTCGLSWAQTDVLNHDVIGVSGTTYSSWSNLTLTSGAVYAGNTAGGNNSIQMRSNNNNSGIVTTTSAGMVTNITVAWNSNTADGRTLNVYGNNTAYEAASDLYGSNAGTLIGTIAKGTTEFEITDEYAFIGIRSASGALYLDEIQITWSDGSGVTPPSITASNVEIAYDATSGTIDYTINNPADDGVLTATTEAEWLTFGAEGTEFTCSVNEGAVRSADVTLIYTYNTDQTATKHVTVTQDGNPNGPGSQNNPYTVAQARAAIDAGAGTQGVYATGIVSAIPTAYSSQYSNITFNMVDNAGDEDFLQAYRCVGDEAANVLVGDIVVVYGNLTKYGSTYEFGQGCQIISLTHTAVTHTLTFGANPAEAGTVTVDTYTSPASIAENAVLDITATPNTGYEFSGWEVTGEGSSVADATSANTTFTMGTADATLTANFTQVSTYTVTYYPNVTGTNPVEVSYNEGEDVTVANNTFTNPGYAFTEWNTNENGTGESYSPGDVIENINADIDLYAQWEESNETVDVLNNAFIGVTGTNYSDWSDKTGTSGAVYAGNSAGGNDAIQLRSNNNSSGIVTTISAGIVTKVTVAWNSNTSAGRTLNVYGSFSPYESASDLYNTSTQGELLGTIVYGTSTELNITGSYTYIGLRSASGAMYLDEIDITWSMSGTPNPSITAENVEIAYNVTDGIIGYTINYEPDPAGTLTAATPSDWLTLGTVGTDNVQFTCTTNEAAAERTATVTLTYSYGDNETVTKNVTVTQAGNPNIINNISDITEVGADYHVRGMVVATSAKGFIICDGTGLVYTYLNAAPTQQMGDFVQITGTTGSYGHVIQFTSNATIAEAEEFTFDWPEYMVITEVPDYTEGNHLSDYFQFEGTLAKSGNYYQVAVGEGQIRISYPTEQQAADLETLLNKTVRIHGFFTGYSGTGNNAVFTAMMESYEEIETPVVSSIIITPTTVNVGATGVNGVHIETLALTYENIVVENYQSFSVQFYDAEGEEQSDYPWIVVGVTGTNDEGYVVRCVILDNDGDARTAYFKVYGYDAEQNVVYSNLVTVTQAEYVAPTVATLPFSFDGGRADIEGTDGLTQEGLGTDYSSAPKLKFDGTGDWLLLYFEGTPGTLSFDIKGNSFSSGIFTVQTSVDGVTYNDLATYTELGNTQNESFDNLGEDVRYIKWIYTEKVNGNVALGNIALAQPDYTPAITLSTYGVSVDAEEHEGTITVTYNNIDLTAEPEVQFFAEDGETSATYDWLVVDLDGNLNVEYFIDANTGEARTAYFKVYGLDNEANDVYSNLVTVTQAAYVTPVEMADYALFTGDLIEGDYLIVYDGRAMNTTVTSGRLQFADVEPENDVIATNDAAVVWHIAPNGDYWTLYNAEANAYAAGTGVNNKAQMLADGTDDKALWTVTGTEVFEFVNKFNAEDRKNANLRNNSTYGFACYSTQTGGALTLYKKVTTTVTYEKEIAGYGESEGGYYLIASPVYGLNPANVTGMTDATSDLYYFDQSEDDEWRNYKVNAFYLTPGKGYLYARTEDVTLTFVGMPYEGSGIVNLTYDENAQFKGWNLIGNPFGTAASLNMPYYRLNSDGSEVSASTESTNVAVMEGVFVEAAETVQTATFTASRNAKGIAQVSIMVSGERGTMIDNAIVRFDGGATLGKFQINENSTKLYIPQDGSDYAVVRSVAEGAMPVNFKANRNGSYTLAINTESVEMDYLHLIDNMTGADVDLLATPSYSFEARTTDYATRFRLVFSANNLNESEDGNSFAFFNGSEWIVNTSNNVTLQVVDVMGHVIVNETMTNRVSTAGMAAGVYVLRLIDGNEVRTQKIVIQ